MQERDDGHWPWEETVKDQGWMREPLGRDAGFTPVEETGRNLGSKKVFDWFSVGIKFWQSWKVKVIGQSSPKSPRNAPVSSRSNPGILKLWWVVPVWWWISDSMGTLVNYIPWSGRSERYSLLWPSHSIL